LVGCITAYMRAEIQLGAVSREGEIKKTEFSEQYLDFNILQKIKENNFSIFFSESTVVFILSTFVIVSTLQNGNILKNKEISPILSVFFWPRQDVFFTRDESFGPYTKYRSFTNYKSNFALD